MLRRWSRLACVGAGLVSTLLGGCDVAEKTAKPAATAAAQPAAPPSPVDYSLRPQRISDLKAIKAALDAYAAEHHSYPKTTGWNGYASAWGASLGDNWIPELTPKYIAALPRDPAKSDKGDGPQYIYQSDGTHFKLLAHYAGDCTPEVEAEGVHIDPVRHCVAYGFWNEGAESM